MGKDTNVIVETALTNEFGEAIVLRKRRMYREAQWNYDSRISYAYTKNGVYIGSIFIDGTTIMLRRTLHPILTLDLHDPKCFTKAKEFLYEPEPD